ncbi:MULTISPECIES: type II toxin-antitoxin system Phd/YefM family antitoxin [unclassified Ectothiorhodospira]|uniref:type II toxin-antitoxin system Phd/YefM family antitoxin n=1 Tax=unclassified Ectothiorhodospira TaxID=2684909 RepID=UPI001EE8BC83|nr:MULTISPECIES: type II toxin-antitoxin system Phd/YefM family antitoxin [unclassified Ectothiorhodospira]MCG5516533.1 type II toxin-antitoxin system Phd/YefM family antitoxin [Ectothiorhodospira sp. 9100]MCG5519268.1 type II toxin-antitoxin system Phd/YefM family antitoxin [Ectothiorhodospira sp. 9905]
MYQEHVTKTQFKAKALEYFRQVETSGGSIVVTDRGEPTVEVRRYRSDQRSPLEKLKGSVVEYRTPTEPVAEDDWEAAS